MNNKIFTISLLLALAGHVHARDAGHHADEATVAAQNALLERNTVGKGYGPQSPRDLNSKKGSNKRTFSAAPAYQQMNLCNIHFHKNAEHKGGSSEHLLVMVMGMDINRVTCTAEG